MNKTIRQIPEEFKFIERVDTQIALENYEDALQYFWDGIKNLLVSNTHITDEEFEYHISAPVGALVRHKLRQQIAVPENSGLGSHLPAMFCSFCGKSESQVDQLIAGPGVFICNKCVKICNQILEEKMNQDEGNGSRS